MVQAVLGWVGGAVIGWDCVGGCCGRHITVCCMFGAVRAGDGVLVVRGWGDGGLGVQMVG
jgi:hypothetical protein